MITNQKPTEMKALKIEKAPQHLGNFLMAMNQWFVYEFGTFTILNTHNADKFKAWMLRNGVREQDLAGVKFSEIEVTFND